ncbi:MAG: hypothetical protein ACOYVF_00615, partial [Candidatus Zixiibacteriota bacterium]
PGQEDSIGNGVGDVCRSCCIGYTGNVNCDDSEDPDISDIAYMINHLYFYGPPLCCRDEADVNRSDGVVDISDIVLIIRHLYISHEDLPDCPLRSGE